MKLAIAAITVIAVLALALPTFDSISEWWQVPFDAAEWNQNPAARSRMVDDLVASRALLWSADDEVCALLGPDNGGWCGGMVGVTTGNTRHWRVGRVRFVGAPWVTDEQEVTVVYGQDGTVVTVAATRYEVGAAPWTWHVPTEMLSVALP